jgi:nucleoid DNA-binding protein
MMNSELTQRAADLNSALKKSDVEIIVKTNFDEISAALKRGDKVVLHGFGRFSVKSGKLKAQFIAGPPLHARQAVEATEKVVFLPKTCPDAIPPIDEPAFDPGPRAKAVLKGLEIAREDLRSSGGSYDLEQVRRLMHDVSRQIIDRRVREGSLLAVPGPSNKRRYPAVQFKEDGKVVEGLQIVQEALPTKNGFAILNFLIRPDRRLGDRKPIDLLKAGEVDLVVEAARRLGEQGA